MGLFGFEIGLDWLCLALNWVCFGFVFQDPYFHNSLQYQQLSSFGVPKIGFVLHN